MKKSLVFVLSVLVILVLVSGCSGDSGEVSQPQPEGPIAPGEASEEPVETGVEGTLCEGENFTIIAPKGWDILEFTASDGFQLYRSGGDAIQIQYAGSNQSDDAAQREVERFAENYDGTEAVETELLGKTFWMTVYEFGGDEQTMYARMEDGVKLTIQTVRGNYENNEEYRAILDTVVFK